MRIHNPKRSLFLLQSKTSKNSPGATAAAARNRNNATARRKISTTSSCCGQKQQCLTTILERRKLWKGRGGYYWNYHLCNDEWNYSAFGWAAIAATAAAIASIGDNNTDNNNTVASKIASCEEESSKHESKPLDKIRMCGDWCATASDESTPCLMDESKVPCRDTYCTTTAGLWNLFVLPQSQRPVSCDMYKAGIAYPVGAKPCDAACLIPEVWPERYPLPTGLGVFCRPGTCSPGATPDPKCPEKFGTLQCPCNWFGSECSDDWVPVTRVDRQWGGSGRGQRSKEEQQLLKVTLHVSEEQWKTVVRDWRPGGVVRLHYLPTSSSSSSSSSKKGDTTAPAAATDTTHLYEMACALSAHDTIGQLQILVAPPGPSMRPEVRRIAELLRSFSSSDVDDNNDDNIQQGHELSGLYVNPSISGFYNGRYEFLMDVLWNNDDPETRSSSSPLSSSKTQDLVFVSSGAGLAGVLPAVEAVAFSDEKEDGGGSNRNRNNQRGRHRSGPRNIHVIHQVRNYEHLPYKDRIERLLRTGAVKFTLIETAPPSSRRSFSDDGDDCRATKTNQTAPSTTNTVSSYPLLSDALAKGTNLKKQLIQQENGAGETKKVYVQHIFQRAQFPLATTAVVVCGHLRIMNDVQHMLLTRWKQERGGDADEWMQERLFLNI